jgi:hypothetical protein
LAAIAAPSFLTEAQIALIVEELGGVSETLKSATAKERAAIYKSLDIRLDYDHRTNQVRATSNLARVVGGVGGATSTLTPRLEVTGERSISAA